MTKPCLPDELVDEIRRLLAQRAEPPDASDVNEALAPEAATVPVTMRAKPVLNVS